MANTILKIYEIQNIGKGVIYFLVPDNLLQITEQTIVPEIPPLQKIDKGAGDGIIIRGRDENNFGVNGFGSIDFSKSFSPSSDFGAKAIFSSILNGENQTISNFADAAIIGAGKGNSIIGGKYSGILAGENNSINGIGRHYFIGAGGSNTIDCPFSTGNCAIVAGQGNTTHGYFNTIINGLTNTIESTAPHGTILSGEYNQVTNQKGLVLQGYQNIASGVSATVINGANSDAKGDFSIVLNGWNIADSFNEIVGGSYGTTYVPASRTGFNITDRAFNIGVGPSDSNRKDGLSVFKNGVATLPTITNALITSASNKVIITREYLEAFSFTDTNALHKTGNESFTGIKSSTNTTSVQSNGISLVNSAITPGYVFYVSNTNTGDGIYAINSGTGSGIRAVNNSSGIGITVNNTSSGTGIAFSNSGSGAALNSFSSSTGNNIVANQSTSGSGFNFVGQNNFVTTFTVNKLGDVTANKYVKTGGTSTQFLMADGSVSVATPTLQVTTAIVSNPSMNTGYNVATGIPGGSTIMYVNCFLECINANNGYLVGDIVTAQTPETIDSGGLDDSGIGIKFRPSTPTEVTFTINNRVDINAAYTGSVGTSGAIGNPITLSSLVNWAVKLIITYI